MKSGLRILLVDDDDDVREVIRLNLELYLSNVIIVEANSGNSAFALFKSDNFDIIISDVRMPDGSGIDLLYLLRKGHPHFPIIFITAYSEVERADAMKQGANEMFSKPVNYKGLVRKILELTNK